MRTAQAVEPRTSVLAIQQTQWVYGRAMILRALLWVYEIQMLLCDVRPWKAIEDQTQLVQLVSDVCSVYEERVSAAWNQAGGLPMLIVTKVKA